MAFVYTLFKNNELQGVFSTISSISKSIYFDENLIIVQEYQYSQHYLFKGYKEDINWDFDNDFFIIKNGKNVWTVKKYNVL